MGGGGRRYVLELARGVWIEATVVPCKEWNSVVDKEGGRIPQPIEVVFVTPPRP
jgi:hypothetical protein